MNILCQNFPFASVSGSDIFNSTLLVNSLCDLKRMRSTVPIVVLGCSHSSQIIDDVFSFQFGWPYSSFCDDINGCFPFLFGFLLLLKLSRQHLFIEKDG